MFVEATWTCETLQRLGHLPAIFSVTALISFFCLLLVKYGIKIRTQVCIASTLFLFFCSDKNSAVRQVRYCCVCVCLSCSFVGCAVPERNAETCKCAITPGVVYSMTVPSVGVLLHLAMFPLATNECRRRNTADAVCKDHELVGL